MYMNKKKHKKIKGQTQKEINIKKMNLQQPTKSHVPTLFRES